MRNFSIELKINCINEAKNSSQSEVSRKCFFHRGVLIERAPYFATLRSLINVQSSVINVKGDNFSKKNKRTGRKSSSISVQG